MVAGTKSKIWFFQEVPVTLRERTQLKAFITRMFRHYKRDLTSINFIFCSDKRVLEVNREYLAHDYYTDIITFELSVPGQSVESEVYVSVDRVRDNASQLGETFKRELHRVIFHGVLHLCGFSDKTSKAEILMRAAEEYWLKRYFK